MMEDDLTFNVVLRPNDLTQFRKKKIQEPFLQLRMKRDPKYKEASK